MKSRRVVSAMMLLLLVSIGAMAAENDGPKYDPSQKEFYLNQADMAFLQPGLNLKIQSVEVNAPNVSVTFRISDNNDQPLDKDGKETPGVVSLSFILARIKPGESQYTNYRTTIQNSPITGASHIVAATDSGGTYTPLGNGVYKYTFGTKLPAGYEADATHTVGVVAERELGEIAEELGLKLANDGIYIANATYNFVPSGKPVTQVRDIVSTAACNQCHDPLGAHHSGQRQQIQICILCHQPQTVDPDTGNTVDFKVFIHKLHMGGDLPSVKAGKPYQIIRVSGGTNYVYDWGHLEWPQDIRNCTTCHQGGTQSNNYKTNPTRVACGSCHDDVNFATGEHHGGGAQTDDSLCAICHPADTGLEFDLSVVGVHTEPDFSKQLKGINVVITGITNTSPGSKPTVTFTVKDNAGNPIDINPSAGRLDSLVLRLAGPTTDYTWNVSENVVTTTSSSATPTSTGYSYTFKTNAIPANAKGSYAVAAEFYNDGVVLSGPLLGQSFTTEETGDNPIRYFSVDGSAVVNRREVVNVNAKCNVCHKRLALHHGNRVNTSYCVMCHNPATTDNPDGARTAGFTVPAGTLPTSINLKFMVHRIHSGEELSRDYTVYRSRGVFNFNEILFPGDLRNCEKCHLGPGDGVGVARTYDLPLPADIASTVAPREFYSPLGPAAAACLGCHDGEDAAAHAFLQTAIFPSGKAAESCAVCHEEGAEFAVSRVHAR